MDNGVNFGWNWNEFDVMNIPVVTTSYIWVPPSEVDLTVDGAVYPGQISPGYWAAPGTVVGSGIDLVESLSLSGFGSNLSWWGMFASSSVKNFSLKSARQPGESTLGCMRRVGSALGGSQIASAWSGLMASGVAGKLASAPVQLFQGSSELGVITEEVPGITVSWLDSVILEGGVDTLYQQSALSASEAIAAYSGPALELGGAVGAGLLGGLAAACR
jgi:hypothetical protein